MLELEHDFCLFVDSSSVQFDFPLNISLDRYQTKETKTIK